MDVHTPAVSCIEREAPGGQSRVHRLLGHPAVRRPLASGHGDHAVIIRVDDYTVVQQKETLESDIRTCNFSVDSIL